jgi:TonB family protein
MAEQAFWRQSEPAEDAVYGSIDEQFRPLQNPFPAMPKPYSVTRPASRNGSEGFVCHKRGANPTALVFSLLVTAALLGMMLLVSGMADRVRPVTGTLMVFSVEQILPDASKPPKEKPVNQPEVYAVSREEAAPSSRQLTVAPAPALPVIPLPAINLASTEVPEVPVTGERLRVIAGADSKGDQWQGALGLGGQGGNGIAGNGRGGAGNGTGSGSQLIASWAPSMDFSQNDPYYPRAARLAKIEGTAWLNCFVLRFDRVRDCKLIAESPSGYGFGKAALKASKGFRVQVHNQSGRRMYNEWVTVKSNFVLPESEATQAANEAISAQTQP